MKPPNSLRAATLALLLSVSCGYDNPSSTVINGPATVTKQAPGIDFTSYKTFSMPDAVTRVTTSSTSTSPTFTCDTSTGALQLLQTVANNLTDAGYTQGPTITCQGTNAPPAVDLAINVSVMSITTSGAYYYPCYWWGYWGYPSYGCYYPYTWYSYSVGTLVTQMSDIKNRPPDGGTIEDVWAALGYALLQSTSTNTANAIDSINQAFAQSPYIHTP